MSINATRSTATDLKMGGAFYRAWHFVDPETGVPFDFTAEPGWIARGRFVGDGNDFTFHSDGTALGLVTFDEDGNVALEMTAEDTATLTPGKVAGDLELVDPVNGDVHSPFNTIELYIIGEVTI